MDDMKYCFSKNVRVKRENQPDEVTCAMFVYNTRTEAEIAFHTEVAYGLSLPTLVLAHYAVTNERGNVYGGLKRLIDNTEQYEAEQDIDQE